jgi:dephospho-CoA kinase
MSTKIIIGLTGPIATGKTTVAKYLAEKYHGKIYGFSGPLRDVLNRLYLPLERPNMALMSNILRANFGENLISRTIASDIEHDECDFIILDGIRRMPDIETMRALPGFHLLSVDAKAELRWKRMTTRGQNADDASKTFEDFLIYEQAEADREIPRVMQDAEATFNNDGDVESLINQVQEYLNIQSFIIN